MPWKYSTDIRLGYVLEKITLHALKESRRHYDEPQYRTLKHQWRSHGGKGCGCPTKHDTSGGRETLKSAIQVMHWKVALK